MPGSSIQAGTRRLIATYFGIGSRLLCILFAAFLFFVCVQVFCLSLSSDFEFSLSYIVQNNQNNRDQISKLAGASLLNYRHVFNHVDIRVCNIDFGPALHGKTWLLREHASDSFLGLTPPISHSRLVKVGQTPTTNPIENPVLLKKMR